MRRPGRDIGVKKPPARAVASTVARTSNCRSDPDRREENGKSSKSIHGKPRLDRDTIPLLSLQKQSPGNSLHATISVGPCPPTAGAKLMTRLAACAILLALTSSASAADEAVKPILDLHADGTIVRKAIEKERQRLNQAKQVLEGELHKQFSSKTLKRFLKSLTAVGSEFV